MHAIVNISTIWTTNSQWKTKSIGANWIRKRNLYKLYEMLCMYYGRALCMHFASAIAINHIWFLRAFALSSLRSYSRYKNKIYFIRLPCQPPPQILIFYLNWIYIIRFYTLIRKSYDLHTQKEPAIERIEKVFNFSYAQ